MEQAAAQIDEAGRLTLPEAVQQATGFRPGAKVRLVAEGESLRVTAEPAPRRGDAEIRQAVEVFAASGPPTMTLEEWTAVFRPWEEEPPGVLD